MVIERIEEWIQQINTVHEPLRRSCSVFQDYFSGFYSASFLASAHFVIVESIPKPDFPELREAGLGDFIDMNAAGITYDDTYYVQQRVANELGLHFHELVHVLQWKQLKPPGFIKRYMDEIQAYGYDEAPLEKMAYNLERCYQAKGQSFDVEEYVRKNL